MRKKHWFSKYADFFSLFGEESKPQIEQSAQSYEIRKDDFIDFDCKPGQDLFVLRQGSVSISLSDKSGRNLILAELEPGEVFGELPVRIDTIGLSIAYATSDSIIYYYQAQTVKDLFGQTGEMQYRAESGRFIFKKKYSTDLRKFLFIDSLAKVARLLVERAGQTGKMHPRGTLVDIPCDAELIARLTGNSLSGVLLGLGSFYGQNLISFDRKKIIIRDMVGLRYWSQ